MSNTVLPITPGSITALTGLTLRPVFFLRLNGAAQPNLVVKGEARDGHRGISDDDALVSIAWGSKLMKNVNNPLVNSKIMTAAEVQIFRQAAAATFAGGSAQAHWAGHPCKWVKMPMVMGLSDAEYYNDDNSVETNRIKKIVPKLLDDAVWHDLGTILAVDIFNGNNDRFDVTSGTWINKGNVMFLEGGTTSMIGLDTFDPNSGDEGNLATGGGFAAMRSLTDANMRDTFALKCTRSVGRKISQNALNSGMGRFVAKVPGLHDATISFEASSIATLYERYAPLLSQGILDGAVALRAYLQGKVQQYAPPANWRRARPGQRLVMGGGRAAAPRKTLPQGIQDRMAYLGW